MNETTKQTAWFLAVLVLVVTAEVPIFAQEVPALPASLWIEPFAAIPDPPGPNGGPQPGEELLYEIRVHNNGGIEATNVKLDLNFPPELSIKSSDLEEHRSGNHWDLGEIGNGDFKDVNVIMEAAKAAVHGIDMTATATADADNAGGEYKFNTTTVDGLCDPPPASGTWLIDKNCTFNDQDAVPAAVEVQAGKVLTIGPGAILEIDLQTYQLKVHDTGGVMIKDGGTIRQTTGTL
ncbi:MAG: hypothetical protein GY842_06345 [bacterium]|nr:hypothetical protein [bacterium]